LSFFILCIAVIVPTNVLANYSIGLDVGWNLISLPSQPSETAITAVTSSIQGKFNSIWSYQTGNWSLYQPGNRAQSDLATMESGKGYWIHMTAAGTLDSTDAPTTAITTIPLSQGWNLVGFGNLGPAEIKTALASIEGRYLSVWAFINNQWTLYDPNNPSFSDLTVISPGAGY